MQESPAAVVYDVDLMSQDMAAMGWLPIDLARKAKVSHRRVGRFFRREFQTARTAAKLAKALGQPIRRYIVSQQQAVAS